MSGSLLRELLFPESSASVANQTGYEKIERTAASIAAHLWIKIYSKSSQDSTFGLGFTQNISQDSMPFGLQIIQVEKMQKRLLSAASSTSQSF